MKNLEKMTIEQAKSILNSITNVDAMQYVADDGIYTPVKAAIANNAAKPANSVILYTCNIKTCALSSKMINLDLAHVTYNFRRAFEHCHYTRCLASLVTEAETYGKAWTLIVEDAGGAKKVAKALVTRHDAITSRIDCAKDAYKSALDSLQDVDACHVVRDFYAATMGGDVTGRTLDAYAPIEKALKTLEEHNADTLNIGELRPLVTKFLGEFWEASNNCEQYRYNCSATLARNVYDVFRVVYQGRKRDKFGNLERKFNYKLGLAELILVIMQDLQRKADASKAEKQEAKEEKNTQEAKEESTK